VIDGEVESSGGSQGEGDPGLAETVHPLETVQLRWIETSPTGDRLVGVAH
jgi:hypothetical protein